MGQRSVENCDVAIVGCGPVGALLAALLGREGFDTLVFERDREIYRLPRAVHFDSEVMRIFQAVGIGVEDIGDTAPILGYEFLDADREILFRFDLQQGTTSQGWAPDYMFHQPVLEATLRGAAVKHPSVSLHVGHEVSLLARHDDHVALEVRDLANGNTRAIRAKYVVGCDGANSFVRKSAGLELEDLEFDEPWLVVDATVDQPPGQLGLPSCPTQLCDPARPITFVPVAGPYIRWEFMLRPEESKDEMLEPQRVRELIAGWVDPEKVEVIRSAVYDFHALVARDWGVGRVLIAGDAAHQTPPFLGQGMCAGIRDAASLAWRLALALRGHPHEELFASYQNERSPHVRAMIGIAVDMGRIICTLDPEAAAKRDASFRAREERNLTTPEMPGLTAGLFNESDPLAGRLGLQARVRGEDGQSVLLDEVTGSGFALLVHGSQSPALSGPAEKVLADIEARLFVIDEARDIDGAYTEWFATHEVDAVLVRPDNYIFGSARGENAASELLEAFGKHL